MPPRELGRDEMEAQGTGDCEEDCVETCQGVCGVTDYEEETP